MIRFILVACIYVTALDFIAAASDVSNLCDRSSIVSYLPGRIMACLLYKN